MGQLLHSSARTTAVVRAAIQRSQDTLVTLARRHRIKPKTVAKWRKRTTLVDAPMGPKPVSTVLIPQQEASVVAFRQQTLLPRHGGPSMTVFMHCRQLFLIFLDQACIAVFNDRALVADPYLIKSRPRKRSLKTTRLAIYTLVLPKYIPRKENPTCLWPLIAPAK